MVFQITVGNLINVIAIAVGIGICALNIFQISASTWMRKDARKYFLFFFSSLLIYIAAHLARQTMEGLPGAGIGTALYIVTFIEFMVTGLMAFMISLLIATVSNPKKPKSFNYVFLALLLIHCVLLIASQFGKFFYFFDENNLYHRSQLYVISNIPQLLMMCIDIYLLIRYRKNIRKRIACALWLYMLLPIFAILLQTFVADVQFIIIATILGAAFMFATIMQDQIEQYKQQRAESNRIETELNMASGIQADMLPNIFPAFPERDEFDVYASMNPAKEVGGDFYDFFLIDKDHLGIVMADVSGKGVPAALFMMVSKILVQNYTIIGSSPAKALEAVNNQICLNNREEMFVTVWLGVLDLTTGKLTSSNAGHDFPALFTPGGDFELVREKHGLVIGAMEGIKYREHEMQMQPGSKLFLYTDGVPEATDANQKLFGTDRMIDALNSAKDQPPKKILEAVDTAVEGFVKDAPQFDDITMLCLEYKGKEQ
ncbi:MAG: PP2C family protein-serine/threonine phosphatase [Clostridia bacterium]|nr:PP2C family protein-serine/threonine phosphatase [Clostridia bacterium]